MADTRPTKVELAGTSRWATEVTIGRHKLASDAAFDIGGADQAPDPEELLLAAYGSCTAMTVQMYAQRKGWPLERIVVRLDRTPAKAGGIKEKISRRLELIGPLDAEQRERLREIANKCPIHKTLSQQPELETTVAEAT